MNRSVVLLAVVFSAGCGPRPDGGGAVDGRVIGDTRLPVERFKSVQPEPWALAANDPDNPTPSLLWNGRIGVRIPWNGGDQRTGKPEVGQSAELDFFSIDRYEPGGEEKIVPIASPLAVRAEWNGRPIDLDRRQPLDWRIDMRTGEMVSQWALPGGGFAGVRTVMHPTERVLAQQWSVEGRGTLKLTHAIRGGQRADDGPGGDRWTVGPDVFRTRWSNVAAAPTTTATERAYEIAVEGSATVDLTIAYGGDAPPAVYTDVLAASKAAWAKRWQTDLEIEGPVEDQQAIRSWMFFLRSGVGANSRMAVSPMGLSSDVYSGHVFWDADVWVFPALALIDPAAAKAIPDYRLRMAAQARRNYDEWVRAGRPTAKGKVEGEPAPPGGLKYPWESSVTGRETVPGPSRFQDHVTGTVAFGLDKAAALGLADREVVDDVMRRAAVFYRARSVKTPRGREIRDTMSPDEHFIGDNDLYTNALANWLANGGGWGDTQPYVLPRDAQGFLTYDGDRFKGYKQAAAVLTIYPLQMTAAEGEARAMMERFEGGVIANGPAMADAVHATVWARLGETDRAYAAWRRSWREFSYPPHLLFSERRRNDRTYFTTGTGGALQTVLYGFLGIRIDSRRDPGAAWSKPLEKDRWLNITPDLPKEWKRATLRNFVVRGQRYTLEVGPNGTTVRPGDPLP